MHCASLAMSLLSRKILSTFRRIPATCRPLCSVHGVVSEEEINKFNECGAVCLRGMFGEGWIEAIKRGIRKVRESPSQYSEALESGSGPAAYFNDHNNWRRIPEFKDYVFNSPAAEITGKLMQAQVKRSHIILRCECTQKEIAEKVLFYHEHVFTKDPGNDRTAPWHQDQPYYPVDGKQVCSVWMPVSPVSRDACIKYVKGSHKWGQWFHPRKFATKKNYDKGTHQHRRADFVDAPDIDGESEKYELLSWDLQPGDCIIFHMLTLHGAPKRSDTSGRQVMVTRWLGEGVCLGSRPWDTSPPYNGKLKPGDPLYPSDDFPLVWSAPNLQF